MHSISKKLFLVLVVSLSVSLTACGGTVDSSNSGTPNNNATSHTTPTTSKPGDGAPTTSKPGDGAPATSKPDDGAPATSKPDDGTPATNKPDNGAPATNKPDDGSAPDDEDSKSEVCKIGYLEETKREGIYGRLYESPAPPAGKKRDVMTEYRQISPEATDKVGVKAPITITFEGGQTKTINTCDDGFFGLKKDSLSSNIGVVNIGRNDCLSHNCPTNFASIIHKQWTDGHKPKIKVVTFGDSIAHYPKGEKWFPQYFKELVAPIADIDNDNIAIVGSTTAEWKPGSAYFDNLIARHNGADVYVFSLGGNDLLKLLKELKDLAVEIKQAHDQGFVGYGKLAILGIKLTAKLATISTTANDIFTNNQEIAERIHVNNPKADIVWIGYPNYGETYGIMDILPQSFKEKVAKVIAPIFNKQVSLMAEKPFVSILDIGGYIQSRREAEGASFNFSYLIRTDDVHLTQEGHKLYSRLLFKLLGGYVLDEDIRVPRFMSYEPAATTDDH